MGETARRNIFNGKRVIGNLNFYKESMVRALGARLCPVLPARRVERTGRLPGIFLGKGAGLPQKKKAIKKMDSLPICTAAGQTEKTRCNNKQAAATREDERPMIISIKHYLDTDADTDAKTEAEGLPSAVLGPYRSALKAMGECGVQVCPTPGEELQKALLALDRRLDGEVAPSVLEETQKQVEKHLRQWGWRTAEYLKDRTSDVKEVLGLMARATESMGERDTRYANKLGQFTGKLKFIADMEDLAELRSSLMESTHELKEHVDRMVEECATSLAEQKAQMEAYRARLEEAERWALRDTLTGLDNRRHVEAKIRFRMEELRPFTLVLLDLDGFKRVNDSCGHLAGDDLLRQFAAELKARFRSTDVVGRWGGDEFILLLDCNLKEASAQFQRIRQWVLGEYEVDTSKGKRKVQVGASIGMAEWLPGMTMNELIDRADKNMYANKGAA